MSLAALTQHLVTAHERTKSTQTAYLALPLEDPGKADAYLTLCAACRAEMDATEALHAERERILAQA
jgi:hypothetical protein